MWAGSMGSRVASTRPDQPTATSACSRRRVPAASTAAVAARFSGAGRTASSRRAVAERIRRPGGSPRAGSPYSRWITALRGTPASAAIRAAPMP